MSEQGIYGKYIIHKADGSEIDPEACYLVLRLDKQRAARKGALQYARSVRRENQALADDIKACVEELERGPCGCREAMCPHSTFSDVWRYGDEVEDVQASYASANETILQEMRGLQQRLDKAERDLQERKEH